MTLTEKQIEMLFKFTSYQGVEYYDLQLELVDHLASAIEGELHNNPTLAPYDALEKVFADFGKKGFKKLIKEKEDIVRSENKKIWISIVKKYFTIPKITFTIVLFAIIYSFSSYINPLQRFNVFISLTVTCFFAQSFFIGFLWKNSKKKLLVAINNGVHQPFGFSVPYLVLFAVSDGIRDDIYFAILVTFLLVFTAASLQFSQQLKVKATSLYPEAFLLT